MLSKYEGFLKGQFFDLELVKAHVKSDPNEAVLLYLCMQTSGCFVSLVNNSSILLYKAEAFSRMARKASDYFSTQFDALLNQLKLCLKDHFSTEFFDCVEKLTTVNLPSAEDAIEVLKNLSKKSNREGFYSALILEHCYRVGLGVQSSKEEQLTYLERLVALIRENKDYDHFIVDQLISGPKFPQNTVNFHRLNFAIVLLGLRQGNITYTWDIFDTNQHLISLLRDNIVRSLRSAENGGDKEVGKLQQLLAQLLKVDINYQLDFYKNYLGLGIPLSGRKDNDTFYDHLSKNKYLLRDVEETVLWDMLAKACELDYQRVKDENATRYFQLHLEISSSPTTAIRLASMAQEGRYTASGGQAKRVAVQILEPNYSLAAHYYEIAIQNAFEQFDFEAAKDAIEQYQKIVQKIPKERRLDINAKIQERLATFSFSYSEKEDGLRSSARANLLITHTKNLKAATYPNYNFTDITALQFIKLLLGRSSALANMSRLCDAYLRVYPKGQAAWFTMVINSLALTNKADPDHTEIAISLIVLLPVIVQSLLEKNPIDLDEILKFLKAFLITDLHMRDLKSITSFLEKLGKCLTNCIMIAATSSNVEDLEKIREILQVSKVLNQKNENYIDQLDVCVYWLERSMLQEHYSNPVSNRELKEIYLLAHYEIKGYQRTFSMLAKSYFEQLKAKGHPEALLKLAQLLILELNPWTHELLFKDLGTNLIKATGCLIPQDKLGIYKTLCFNTLSELKKKVDSDPAFTDKQKGIVHFYYALSLLIFDKQKFDDQKTTFFQGHNYRVVVPSILVLFKDSKFEFTDGVRHHLLKMIVGIGNVLDPSLLNEANFLLKQTPPDASILGDLEKENALLTQQAQSLLDQIASMNRQLEDKDQELKRIDDQVGQLTNAVPTLTARP